MTVQGIITEAVSIIRRHLSDDYTIYLYGSIAKGNAHPGSDIDIAILGVTRVPHSSMMKIISELDTIRTLRSIDLVDLNSKDESFKQEVLQTGIEIEHAGNLQLIS